MALSGFVYVQHISLKKGRGLERFVKCKYGQRWESHVVEIKVRFCTDYCTVEIKEKDCCIYMLSKKDALGEILAETALKMCRDLSLYSLIDLVRPS